MNRLPFPSPAAAPGLVLALVLTGLVPLPAVAADPAARLIPRPRSIVPGEGVLTLTAGSRIAARRPELEPLARVLAGDIERALGVPLETAAGPDRAGDIALDLDPSLAGEAHVLEVGDRATVKGADYAAAALGTATLLQLLEAAPGGLAAPRVRISDAPAHPYRGLLLDLARKYHSPGGVKQVIELCRLYKIRYIHLHLTDDQLFMFPSKRFPAAGKGNHEFARFEPASKPRIEPYTLEELRELERFSQERAVHLVPEIDLPGHSGRLVGDVPAPFAIPGNGSTVNIASPAAVAGVAALLEEVMDVFRGSPYVHVGGDEVGLGGLEGSPEFKEMQARFPAIGSAHDLYCKFIADLHDVIARRGKKMIVWEEAGNAGGPFPLPRDTTVMVWALGRNPAELARAGYPVVNAGWVPLYIVRDNRKSLEFLFRWSREKFGREGSEDYSVVDTDLAARLAGAQLCSWENSEAIEIGSLRDRLALVAERTWNPAAGGTFEGFRTRLAATDRILDDLVHPIRMEVKGRLAEDGLTFEEPLEISLAPKGKAEGLRIRYALDNSLPGAGWRDHAGPIVLKKTAHLRAGLFDAAGRQEGYLLGAWFKGRVRVPRNLATGRPVTVGPGPDRTDAWGARNAVDGWDEDVWAHWASSDGAPQWLQVDLEGIHRVGSIRVITFHDGGRYYQLDAELSRDGKEWRKVLEFRDTAPATAEGYQGSFDPVEARYVRIDMRKNSANPYVHIVELIVDEAK